MGWRCREKENWAYYMEVRELLGDSMGAAGELVVICSSHKGEQLGPSRHSMPSATRHAYNGRCARFG